MSLTEVTFWIGLGKAPTHPMNKAHFHDAKRPPDCIEW
jgi:hypothetical protein